MNSIRRMDLYTLIGFCVGAALICLCVRALNGAVGRQASFAAACFGMLTAAASIEHVIDEIGRIAELGGMGAAIPALAFKAVGIAYITRIAASVCTDLGESTLAETAELAGRLLLVGLCLPIIGKLAELLIELINSSI